MCKYPRELRFKISTHVTRRPRANRISFLPCDNASSGVIAPRCVYIDGISMASKEFVIAGRSRCVIYRGLSERMKTRSAPILICSPRAAMDCSVRVSSHSFESPVRSNRRGCRCHNPHVRHHLITSVSLFFPSDTWYQPLIRLDIDKKWKYLYVPAIAFSLK